MLRFVRSAWLALSGIVFAIRTERHMQFHCVAAVIVISLGTLVSLNIVEWAIICFAITLVISAELVNTAIEQAVNLASPERHPIAKIAKDVAAGAVLAAVFGSIIVGLLIIGPPLWHLVF
ncbi:diacylglycerol kinase family protein [Paenibacillus sp. GSMTC-2017]|uniref:diacylglycerol kinase family protein n=1 Tax=Paenibacillus sp. GSMTC-2017 TaxID=2794350 RepID=UPI0018D71294|nr:diacylglycerol kinase family protein [Paenibacillus sp. GSMTC-2017]MBH5318127.1 diacylglycerol kinase family protein [Paenibacillus sp. GSMTC-2017]